VNLKDAKFADVALVGARFSNINFSNVSIQDSNLEGMKINGVLVSELIRTYELCNEPKR
jgi:uncharacterized protein YjbI with pentapeptide repeats